MDQGMLHRQLKRIEGISYFLLLIPVLTDLIERGRLPHEGRELVTEITLGLIVLLFIKALQRARIKIERLETARQTLTELIVHDLKNPMTTVMASLSCLTDADYPEESRRKLLASALKSCNAQMELMDRLLEVERLESGLFPLRVQPIDLSNFLNGCLQEWTGPAVLKEIELRTAPAYLAATVTADPELLRRVIGNLLQNALKYTPTGGRVELGATVEKDRVRIRVADSGRGVGDEERKRLFDRYYRVEGRDQATHAGTGLGLYFCRLAVEAHGGTIAVADGAGMVVLIDLPLAPARTPPPVPSRPAIFGRTQPAAR